jgi:hypothetical protein
MTTTDATLWRTCERCGPDSMDEVRRFPTPGKPWREVVWRRCRNCAATSVEHVY